MRRRSSPCTRFNDRIRPTNRHNVRTADPPLPTPPNTGRWMRVGRVHLIDREQLLNGRQHHRFVRGLRMALCCGACLLARKWEQRSIKVLSRGEAPAVGMPAGVSEDIGDCRPRGVRESEALASMTDTDRLSRRDDEFLCLTGRRQARDDAGARSRVRCRCRRCDRRRHGRRRHIRNGGEWSPSQAPSAGLQRRSKCQYRTRIRCRYPSRGLSD